MSTDVLVIVDAVWSPDGSETPPDRRRRALEWNRSTFEAVLDDPAAFYLGDGGPIERADSARPTPPFEGRGIDALADRLEAGGDGASAYVCPAGVVCTPETVEPLASADGEVVAVGSDPESGRETGLEASAEPAPEVAADGAVAAVGSGVRSPATDAPGPGLLKLSGERLREHLPRLEGLSERKAAATLYDDLRGTGDGLASIAVDGWTTLDAPESVAAFALDTKATTLRRLEPQLERATVMEPFVVTVDEWTDRPRDLAREIRTAFDGDDVIVRSSARVEDGWDGSHAGQFESVLDVPSDDEAAVVDAVETVIDSYDDDPRNQVLVQRMVPDTVHSGVVMTRTVESASPYYVVNYDAETDSTESVTDGTGDDLRTTVVRKDALSGPAEALESTVAGDSSFPLRRLLEAVVEVEATVDCDRLDVEFAVSADGEIHVLQVRPIPTAADERRCTDEAVYDAVDDARESFRDAQTAAPAVVGDRTVFGVMPDWNPAEIIGRRPRLLADSLYRELIVDDVWARQRAAFGYRDVRPHPLMRSFGGQPYVDARAMFNSFVPASVPDEVAETLCTHYLDRLEANPELHDKVEFEVAITCLSFDFDRHVERLSAVGLTDAEIEGFREGLGEITREAYERASEDVDRIERLSDRHRETVDADLPPLRRAWRLLEDCREYGTLPFAHLARSAFVAVELLRSLERTGVLAADQRTTFLASLNTVATDLDDDAYRVSTGDLEWEAFVERYGHLRPGTYEITSASYGDDPETYLRPLVENATEPEQAFDPLEAWDESVIDDVEAELAAIGLPADAESFVSFLRTAIEGREYAKFCFSRNLSAALEAIAEFGERNGLSRETLSHVRVGDLRRLTGNRPPTDVANWLRTRAEEGRAHHELTTAVELPPLITDEADFGAFDRPSRDPNFVTERTATGDVVAIEDAEIGETPLEGTIVVVPQADPGYDWLFGHDVAGLVTMYGGVNSHMAVRAAEFSTPAAIGVGEALYEQVLEYDVVELDCAGMRIRNP